MTISGWIYFLPTWRRTTANERAAPTATTLPKITLPDLSPPTPEEIERRRVIVARMRELRDEIGPIGISTEDLIHELRGGDDRFGK